MAKLVYGWVVDWQGCNLAIKDYLPADAQPKVTVDLFFSSVEKFKEIHGCYASDDLEVLVPCFVGDDFNDLDYIPDNY